MADGAWSDDEEEALYWEMHQLSQERRRRQEEQHEASNCVGAGLTIRPLQAKPTMQHTHPAQENSLFSPQSRPDTSVDGRIHWAAGVTEGRAGAFPRVAEHHRTSQAALCPSCLPTPSGAAASHDSGVPIPRAGESQAALQYLDTKRDARPDAEEYERNLAASKERQQAGERLAAERRATAHKASSSSASSTLPPGVPPPSNPELYEEFEFLPGLFEEFESWFAAAQANFQALPTDVPMIQKVRAIRAEESTLRQKMRDFTRRRDQCLQEMARFQREAEQHRNPSKDLCKKREEKKRRHTVLVNLSEASRQQQPQQQQVARGQAPHKRVVKLCDLQPCTHRMVDGGSPIPTPSVSPFSAPPPTPSTSIGMEALGRRVKVWWGGDDCWYRGVIQHVHNVGLPGSVQLRFWIKYDDGELKSHFLNEACEVWRYLPQ